MAVSYQYDEIKKLSVGAAEGCEGGVRSTAIAAFGSSYKYGLASGFQLIS
jgi:hypothetical protein